MSGLLATLLLSPSVQAFVTSASALLPGRRSATELLTSTSGVSSRMQIARIRIYTNGSVTVEDFSKPDYRGDIRISPLELTEDKCGVAAF
jgi:hypothetical protein